MSTPEMTDRERQVNRARHGAQEQRFADGRWGCYRLCIGCMDKWLTEIGRTPASPNAKVSGAPATK